MISKIDNDPYQIERDVKHRAVVEQIPRQQIIPNVDDNTSEEDNDNDRILPNCMPDDDEVPSEDQECYDRVPPQEASDDDVVRYEDQ